MLIETTINVNMDLKRVFIRMVKLSGKTQRQVISFLLHKLKEEYGISTESWTRLRYQGRDPQKRWCKQHIILSPGEYEYCMDLKKVCKYSLSGLIAFAIEKYLNDMACLYDIDTDNYHCSNYIFSKMIIDGIICLQFFWGIPKIINTIPSIANNSVFLL